MRRLVPVLFLALVACPKSPPPSPKKVVEEERPSDPSTAVRALLTAAYAAFEAAEPERLDELITADAMIFGLGPSETFNARGPLVDRLRQELMPLGLRGDTVKVTDSDIRVGLADGGGSAWLIDLPKVTVTHQDEESTWLPRLTAHAILEGGRWQLDALHVSLSVPDKDFYAPEGLIEFTSPTEVVGERGPDSDELIGATRRMQEDLGVKLDRISSRDDVFLLGSSLADVYPGREMLDLKPRLPEFRKTWVAPKLDGPLRSRLAPNRRTGWVAGVIVLRHPTSKKPLPPLRALWIYAEEKGFWNLVSEHTSVPLKVEQRPPASPEELKGRKTLPAAKKTRKYEDSDIPYW